MVCNRFIADTHLGLYVDAASPGFPKSPKKTSYNVKRLFCHISPPDRGYMFVMYQLNYRRHQATLNSLSILNEITILNVLDRYLDYKYYLYLLTIWQRRSPNLSDWELLIWLMSLSHFLVGNFSMTWLFSSQTVLSSNIFCAFKRNYDCTSYYDTFKWKINENCFQLLKKKRRRRLLSQRQWQIFPDVSWWSHSWKLMARKLSKHRSNKEKISSHRVNLTRRGVPCCGKFGDKHKDFFHDDDISCLQALATKRQKIPLHISIPKSWLLLHDPIFPNVFPPHPSFEHKPQCWICWNKTLIRTKTFFFLSLLGGKWQAIAQNKEMLPVDPSFFPMNSALIFQTLISFPDPICKAKTITGQQSLFLTLIYQIWDPCQCSIKLTHCQDHLSWFHLFFYKEQLSDKLLT